ncbi:hypothetical protein HDU93_003054, partial [Gonapodya sp. JEL0774]
MRRLGAEVARMRDINGELEHRTALLSSRLAAHDLATSALLSSSSDCTATTTTDAPDLARRYLDLAALLRSETDRRKRAEDMVDGWADLVRERDLLSTHLSHLHAAHMAQQGELHRAQEQAGKVDRYRKLVGDMERVIQRWEGRAAHIPAQPGQGQGQTTDHQHQRLVEENTRLKEALLAMRRVDGDAGGGGGGDQGKT